uniref:U1764e n=1 Tax=Mycobacterium leprae TaxID=1769 RepID=Q49986_MYCLR|nr:u1764e [Mycobacterium leprae]
MALGNILRSKSSTIWCPSASPYADFEMVSLSKNSSTKTFARQFASLNSQGTHVTTPKRRIDHEYLLSPAVSVIHETIGRLNPAMNDQARNRQARIPATYQHR